MFKNKKMEQKYDQLNEEDQKKENKKVGLSSFFRGNQDMNFNNTTSKLKKTFQSSSGQFGKILKALNKNNSICLF